MEDHCLDGGLTPLFMPAGESEPWEWPYAVRLYEPAELPREYEIRLREPFRALTVQAIQQDKEWQRLVLTRNDSIQLDPLRFGECVAYLEGTVDIDLLDTEKVQGLATLEMGDPRGDEKCPASMPSQCTVRLYFEAERAP